MLIVPCDNFIMYFFWVLLLSGLQKLYLHKSSFWWIVHKSCLFWNEWRVKDSNSYLWPHFPDNAKPLFLSKLQLSPKEHLSHPKLRGDETLGIQPLLQPTRVSLNCMFTAMKFFQTGVMMSSQPPSLCALLLLFFFIDDRVFSQQLSVWYNLFCESLSWVCREIANILISSVFFCVFWVIYFL